MKQTAMSQGEQMENIAQRARFFCDRFGISKPLVGAPMTGVSSPELAAAVSNAGGLGMLALDLSSPEDIIGDISHVRELTDRPFAVNLRIPPRDRGDARQAERVDYALGDLRKELGLPEKTGWENQSEPDFDEQFDAVMACGVPVVSCSCGGFREKYEERLHKAGVLILGAATTLREAKVQRAAHADAVVLQGVEAGGPRLYFESEPGESVVALGVLLSECRRAIRLPLVAAGGISTGNAAAAALVAGASAVMVGTAIACSPESKAPDLMKRSMVAASDTATCLTDLLSGRLERVMSNGLVEALKRAGVQSAGYPYQRYVMQCIMEAAARAGRGDLLRMPVGQGATVFCCRRAAESLGDIVEGLDWAMSL